MMNESPIVATLVIGYTLIIGISVALYTYKAAEENCRNYYKEMPYEQLVSMCNDIVQRGSKK